MLVIQVVSHTLLNVLTKHRVSLPTASLPVSEDGAVIAVEDLLVTILDEVINLLLSRVLAKDLIISTELVLGIVKNPHALLFLVNRDDQIFT